jgi:UDP-N-acetylglucosamine diphosphorylase/glucosamine-1-phosphate N-acetyltransferase
MGAKIKGDTTVGPFSKVGGEVSNSVVFGYSNKAHDGFIGNTVVGEWCNLGADTNTSNLKNNYAEVKLWDYEANDYTSTGQQFCGTMMGDHGKCGINTMLNTGTVMGVCANVFGADFQKQFVPSFSWGNRRYATFQLDKAFEVAERVMARRQVPFTEADRRLLAHVFEITEPYRK